RDSVVPDGRVGQEFCQQVPVLGGSAHLAQVEPWRRGATNEMRRIRSTQHCLGHSRLLAAYPASAKHHALLSRAPLALMPVREQAEVSKRDAELHHRGELASGVQGKEAAASHVACTGVVRRVCRNLNDWCDIT